MYKTFQQLKYVINEAELIHLLYISLNTAHTACCYNKCTDVCKPSSYSAQNMLTQSHNPQEDRKHTKPNNCTVNKQ